MELQGRLLIVSIIQATARKSYKAEFCLDFYVIIILPEVAGRSLPSFLSCKTEVASVLPVPRIQYRIWIHRWSEAWHHIKHIVWRRLSAPVNTGAYREGVGTCRYCLTVHGGAYRQHVYNTNMGSFWESEGVAHESSPYFGLRCFVRDILARHSGYVHARMLVYVNRGSARLSEGSGVRLI